MKSFLLILCAFLAFGGSDSTRERRVVGGVDNVAGQVPWAVSLRTLQGEHFCTASIVNNWWVITAAHCVVTRTAASIGMLMGRVTLDGSGGIQRQGFRITTHPSYDAETLNFDLGLVQTSVIITFSTTVQSIFLADTFTGGAVHVKVSGWGTTSSEGGPTSNNLRTLDTTTLTNNDCRALHWSWNAERITTNNICTNNRQEEGFCGTGVGGPLVWNSQLVGVASWNVPCAFGYPDVYVRISQLRTWILTIIGNN